MWGVAMLSRTVSFLIAALFSLTGTSAIAADAQQGTAQKWQPQTPKVKKEVRQQQRMKQQVQKQQMKDCDKQSPQMQQRLNKTKGLTVPAGRQIIERKGPGPVS